MQYGEVLWVLIGAREKSGLSQAELAERLDKSEQFVAQYEQGTRHLDIIEFADVAEALGLDPVNELRQAFFPMSDLEVNCDRPTVSQRQSTQNRRHAS